MMPCFRLKMALTFIIYWCGLSSGNSLFRKNCQSDEFHCAEGGCVEKSQVCDGFSHCRDSSDESPEACGCGQGNVARGTSAIEVGVHEASVGSQPWHVALFKAARHHNHYAFLCSGTLIYTDIVLTTASCVVDPVSRASYPVTSLLAFFGKVGKDYDAAETFEQKIEVEAIEQVPNYDGDRKGYVKNLAIIKLKKQINKSNIVNTACLWSSKSLPGSAEATISGWGLQSTNSSVSNLKVTVVRVVDIRECLVKFSEPMYRFFLNNDKFCIIFDKGTGLTADDTGNPVIVFYRGRFRLLGVISVQVKNSEFGIATKVNKYLDWIKTAVYGFKEKESCLNGSHFTCHADSKCIRKEKVCDGVRDCHDNSDESPLLCSSLDFAPFEDDHSSTCDIPESGEIFNGLNCTGPRGCKSKSKANSNSVYQVTCPTKKGFAKLGTNAILTVCSNGQWIPPLNETKCLPLCPGQEYKTLELHCRYMGEAVPCTEPLIPRTSIRVNCKRKFKREKLVNYADQTECEMDGNLKHVISKECIPACGNPFDDKGKILISKGERVNYAKYPWHAAVYWIQYKDGKKEYSYECGGTLIDTNKILTAGHCVWREQKSRVIEAAMLVVALGKYYSDWSISEPLVETHEVDRIIHGTHYIGVRALHSQDIAVLILKKDVEINDYIMPACLDLRGAFGKILNNEMGHVIGWGSQTGSEEKMSDELMESWLEYLDLATCRRRYRKYDFDSYLQDDKFCAVYMNGSGPQEGDSGGGFTIVREKLHYVYGVVSLKKHKQDVFVTLTNVVTHGSWLQQILDKF